MKNLVAVSTFISHLLLCMLTVFTVFSCSSTYIPASVNAPLLSNKGEIALRIHSGSSMLDVQSAVGLSENTQGGVAAMLNGSISRTQDRDGGSDFTRHEFAELGLGYFFKLGDAGILEFFTGYGLGQVSSNFVRRVGPIDLRERIEGHYQRVFLQADVGATSRFFGAGFTTRAAYVYFPDFTINGHTPPNKSALFLEPVLFLRSGGGPDHQAFPNIKAELQFGVNLPAIGNPEFEFPLFHVHAGIDIRLNRHYGRDRPVGVPKQLYLKKNKRGRK